MEGPGRITRHPRDDPLVLVVQVLPSERHFLLISLSTRKDVQLVRFDDFLGTLLYGDEKGVDVFDTDGEALDYLKQEGQIKVLGKGKAVLGYVVVGNTGLLLIAENARVSATLPGGHQIRTVTNTAWHRIPCQTENNYPMGLSREELEERIKKIIDFPLNGAHWYCETVDVTRPFPSQHEVKDPSWDFVWNRWLSEAFRSTGLLYQCPSLLQGTAELRDLEDFDGKDFKLLLLSRRSRLHPGTRYVARGLNEDGEPGNEIECEQVIWHDGQNPDKGPVHWSSYCWRRGSVPIRWGVVIRNGGLGEAEINIRRENTFKGTRRYVRRLQKRFAPKLDLEASSNGGNENRCDASSAASTSQPVESNMESPFASQTSEEDPTKAVNVVFVSLLRKGTPDRDRNEGKLATAFDRALLLMRRDYKLPMTYFALDWHEMDKQLGTHEVIEALWTLMNNTIHTHGFAQGQYISESDDPTVGETSGSKRTYWYGRRCMEWSRQQKGVSRYNCADSLDRTNVASFFISVQVFVEQCRCLGLNVATDGKGFNIGEKVQRTLREKLWGPKKAPMDGSSAQNLRAASPELSPRRRRTPTRGRPPTVDPTIPVSEDYQLPKGWERRKDIATGKTYYVDHNRKRTSWDSPGCAGSAASQGPVLDAESGKEAGKECAPAQLKPFQLLDCKVEEFRQKVLPEALTTFAEIFLMSGDRNAFFYTGSQAMHSDKIMIFEPETSALRKSGAGSIGNWSIAISRRYNNLMRDHDRQAQIEMFLGINPDKHFLTVPSLEGRGYEGPLHYVSPKLVPTDFGDTDDESDPISQMSYPPPLSSCHFAHGNMYVDGMPHSQSIANLTEQDIDSGVGPVTLLGQRSLSESNLAGLALDQSLDRAISFCKWNDASSDSASGMDNGAGAGAGASAAEVHQGLREVPVDASPLGLS